MPPISRSSLFGTERVAALRKLRGEIVIWWYGPVAGLTSTRQSPNVIVFVRPVLTDGSLGDIFTVKVALNFLGLLRIGTIWVEGVCVGEWAFLQKNMTFSVNFDLDSYEIVSPYDNPELPNVSSGYPLPYSRDKNWMLRFPLQGGRQLLLPCMEFLARGYGSNKLISQTLSTLPWEDCLDRFFVPTETGKTAEVWPIKLTERMREQDAVLLAHLLHDPYTQRAAKSIYGQLGSRNQGDLTFLKILPWFESQARIRVNGLWVDRSNTFLALRLSGMSDPQGVSVLIHRNTFIDENPALPDDTNDTGNLDRFGTLLVTPPIVDLTDQIEPDRKPPQIAVVESGFALLGHPRTILTLPQYQRRQMWRKDKIASELANEAHLAGIGEGEGADKDVDEADIHSTHAVLSAGVVFDLWNIFKERSGQAEGGILEAAYFTFEDGFQTDDPPLFIALRKPHENAERKILRWTQMFPDNPASRMRGILVLRLTLTEGIFYLFEIERRFRHEEEEDGSLAERFTEEAFKGFLMVAIEEQFHVWLSYFLDKVRETQGVIKNIDFPQDQILTTVFVHSSGDDTSRPGEYAVENALKKARVLLAKMKSIEAG
ncbi:hypothetical protein IHN63_02770 [Deinococcus sp. 6YEL10]|uniref:hypothetical protein n=1 Tax=Deinococcus sp. 6YEL10 TaxID=2745870 RepID=UPI001E4D67B8|nr:hypothetical protein [Deinococcus sp. 6YEL10]MCD0160222.1 hypothetical protein [Deinococcus sp. 6YEL10]